MKSDEYSPPSELRPLAEALARNWQEFGRMDFVRSFSNLVYRFNRDSRPLYLRISAAQHRSEAMIASELAFIRFLGRRGFPAAQPEASRTGSFIHAAEHAGDLYHACVFQEAPGAPFSDLAPASQVSFLEAAGQCMGLLHETARAFERPESFIRFAWREDRWRRFAEHVPRRETSAWRLHDELQSWLETQPSDARYFGLIHGDFTIANLRVRNHDITVFDFDSCCEHWYAYEIATFLHYFGGMQEADRQEAYDAVMRGYGSIREVDDALRAQIPIFGKMRLLYSFLVFAQEWGFENLTQEQEDYYAFRRRLFGTDPIWPMP